MKTEELLALGMFGSRSRLGGPDRDSARTRARVFAASVDRPRSRERDRTAWLRNRCRFRAEADCFRTIEAGVRSGIGLNRPMRPSAKLLSGRFQAGG